MADIVSPPTPQEALLYEKEALLKNNEKRLLNIDIFKKAIADEEAAITRNLQMVALIDIHRK